jgi:hypothetical protein
MAYINALYFFLKIHRLWFEMLNLQGETRTHDNSQPEEEG